MDLDGDVDVDLDDAALTVSRSASTWVADVHVAVAGNVHDCDHVHVNDNVTLTLGKM